MRIGGAKTAAALVPVASSGWFALSWPAFALWMLGITLPVLVLDVLTGSTPQLVPILVFLPTLAMAAGTVRQTLLASLWALLVASLLLAFVGELDDNLLAVFLLAVFGALSVGVCRYRIRRTQEITRLRSTLAALQRRILRPLPQRTGQVWVEGLYRPVEEETMIGGDVYEVAKSPYGTRIMIGDVQGKGLAAVDAAFTVLGAFREAAQREASLSGVAAAMESTVVRHNDLAAQGQEAERFVTVLLLDIDDAGRVQLVNCGHIPPYLLDASGVGPLPLSEPGVPLGLAQLSGEPCTVDRFDLPEDALLLVCTDGVTEARAPSGDFYPLEERLRAWTGLPADQVVGRLGTDLYRFTEGDFRDDIAVLAIGRASC